MPPGAQFDVCRTRDGVLVVVIQSDLLEAARTRVVAPLLPRQEVGTPLRGLNPVFAIGEADVVLMTQLAATLTLSELGERAGSLAHKRDEIVRALDMLLSGV